MTKVIHISDALHNKLKREALDENKSLTQYVEEKLS
jgi:predicted HicB family RNase H-like nuclease